MNKIKNVHSPSGMGYSLYGTHHKFLIDCPKCKYGTVDKIMGRDQMVSYKCADCQWKWTEEEWKKLKDAGIAKSR